MTSTKARRDAYDSAANRVERCGLQDMREAIANARDDLGAQTKDEFLAGGKTQRAVIKICLIRSSAKPSKP